MLCNVNVLYMNKLNIIHIERRFSALEKCSVFERIKNVICIDEKISRKGKKNDKNKHKYFGKKSKWY